MYFLLSIAILPNNAQIPLHWIRSNLQVFEDYLLSHSYRCIIEYGSGSGNESAPFVKSDQNLFSPSSDNRTYTITMVFGKIGESEKKQCGKDEGHNSQNECRNGRDVHGNHFLSFLKMIQCSKSLMVSRRLSYPCTW